MESPGEAATRTVIPIGWVLGIVLFSVVAAVLGIGVTLLCGRDRKSPRRS